MNRLLLLAALLLCAGAAHGQTGSPAAARATSVWDAAYVGDRLWLRSNLSDLSFVTADGRSDRVLDGFVDGICVRDGRLVILYDDQPARTWRLRRWNGQGWNEEATVAYGEDEYLGAFACRPERTTLLTTSRIVRLEASGTWSFPVPAREGRARFTGALSDTGAAIYYGLTAGEFRGGGLVRVDAATKEAAFIDASVRPGWRHLDLNPTTGLAPSPWRPGCVIAAMGLNHGSGWGNVSEVCETTVRALYVKPFSPSRDFPPPVIASPYENVGFSVPFYQVESVGEVVWARAWDGVYRIDRTRAVAYLGKPALKRLGGYWVNFDNPEAVFVHPTLGDDPSPYTPVHIAPRH
jgi:hypothetical protein